MLDGPTHRPSGSSPTADQPSPIAGWVSTGEAAAILNVSTRTMRRYLAAGIEGAVKDRDSGVWQLPAEWVNHQLEQRRAGRAVSPALAGETAASQPRSDEVISLRDPEVADGLFRMLEAALEYADKQHQAELQTARAEAHAESLEQQLAVSDERIRTETAIKQLEADAASLQQALIRTTIDLEDERTRRGRLETELDRARDRQREAETNEAVTRAELDLREASAIDHNLLRDAHEEALQRSIKALQARHETAMQCLGRRGRRRFRRISGDSTR